MPEKICPRCGKSSRVAGFIGAFCKDCYVQRQPLYELPELVIDRCVKCGKLRLRGFWTDERNLPAYLKEKIKTRHRLASVTASVHAEPDSRLGSVDLGLVVEAEGQSVLAKERWELQFNKTQCPDCALQAGGYHEAIIQFRGDAERVERALQKYLRNIEAVTFVAKVIPHKEGPDVLVGKKRPALELLSKLNFDFTVANKLVGEKQNKRVYRTTACVRLD